MSQITSLNKLIDVTRGESGLSSYPRPNSLVLVDEHPYIEVHHSVYPASMSGADQVRTIDRQHRNQGWNGMFYGIGIDLDGVIYEGRGAGFRSIDTYSPTYYADDGSYVHPHALCVVLFGNFDVSTMSWAMRDSLNALRSLMPDTRLRFHRGRAATKCPGDNAMPIIRDMNSNPPTPTPDPTPAPTPKDDDMELLYDTSNWNTWIHFGGGKVVAVKAVDFHPWWAAQAKKPAEFAWTGPIRSHPYMTVLVNKMSAR